MPQLDTEAELKIENFKEKQPLAHMDKAPAAHYLVVMRAKDMTRWLGRFAGVGLNSRNFH